MIPWLLIAALALIAILITALMAIIAVGHQTEERPGTIDLTGIKPVSRWYGLSAVEAASRVRAEAATRPGYPTLAEAFAASREELPDLEITEPGGHAA